MPLISVLVAIAENGIIGHQGKLPWHLPEDLRYFKKLTTGHTVIMGRKTQESIGKPLPNRRNIVVTTQKDCHPLGYEVAHSLDEAQALCAYEEEIFFIGGATLLEEVFAKNISNRLYITYIHAEIQGDTFLALPDLSAWEVVHIEARQADERHSFAYTFVTYDKK